MHRKWDKSECLMGGVVVKKGFSTYYLTTQPPWLLWNELMRDITSPTIIRMQVFSECARCLAFIIWKFLSFPTLVKRKLEHVQQNYKQFPVWMKKAAYLMNCIMVIVSPANECFPCYFREVAEWHFSDSGSLNPYGLLVWERLPFILIFGRSLFSTLYFTVRFLSYWEYPYIQSWLRVCPVRCWQLKKVSLLTGFCIFFWRNPVNIFSKRYNTNSSNIFWKY